MRYRLLVVLICLGLVFDLGVYIATSDNALKSFDPRRPVTLLSIIANRFHDLRAQVGAVLRGRVDEFAAPYHKRVYRDIPTGAGPQ